MIPYHCCIAVHTSHMVVRSARFLFLLICAAGFSPGLSMRDAPGFGHSPGFGAPGGHAFPEHRGDPTPAGTGRGFAIGRGRAAQGTHPTSVPPYAVLVSEPKKVDVPRSSSVLNVTSSSHHVCWTVLAHPPVNCLARCTQYNEEVPFGQTCSGVQR